MPTVQQTKTFPSAALLDAVVRRIVEAVHPKKIVLFGSAARGTMTEHSDLDLLVIMPDGVHRRNTTNQIYMAMKGLGVAKDIVVVTESDVAAYRWEPSLIIMPALDEGRVVYGD